jgi:hypothetical protein
MKSLIAASLSALTLAACASAPVPREAAGAYSEGYTERALSADRYLVSYRMDGADYQRAYDLALWRAAQLSLEKGYPTFEVVDRDSDTDAGARATTSFTTQHGVAYQRSCGLVSCTTYATPTTWSQVELNADGRRPSRVVSLEVIFTRNPADGSPNRYDAVSVVSNSRIH